MMMSFLFLLLLTAVLMVESSFSNQVEKDEDNDCYQLSRSSTLNIDIERNRKDLKELHVRHNFKGQVVLENGGTDSHVVSVSVITDASSKSMLDRVQVTHRLVEITEWKSILLLQADFAAQYGENWSGFYYTICIIMAFALSAAIAVGVIWTCYKRGRICFFREGGNTAESDGNMLAMTDTRVHFSSPVACRLPLPSTSVKARATVDDMTTPLAGSVSHSQASRSFILLPDNPPRCVESCLDVKESPPEHSRTSRRSHERRAELRFSSPSSTGSSRRIESTSILTVMVVALTMSVHTVCVPELRVQLIIKLPQNLQLDHVKIFYNVKYNNPVDVRAWNRSDSILQVYDLPNATTTSNVPCDDELVCPGATSLHLSACDWSTRECVCPRGSAIVNDLCTPVSEQPDPGFISDELQSIQIRTTASSNLFLENLQNARNLETTYYVTDAKQLTDFFWYRDSGIRVNVGLQNIDVISTYEDVGHEGDSDFMMQNPSAKSELEFFRNVQVNYCRYPMPDYYSLTLEIAKDRTTKASMEVCTMEMYSAGSCREGLYVGENYIKRELNEPCHRVGSYPEPLLSAANSIVCTESTSLLTAIFNVTPATVHAIPFVSDACRLAGTQCDQCLNQPRCQQLDDDVDRACCHVECYLKPECKLATSRYCKNAPLECAQGDSYRYTLQPVFSDMRNMYQCHIRRKSPAVLYELWFYVSIPSSEFETPRIYSSIKVDKNERRAGRGQHRHEFMMVEYSTDVELEEDLVLVGRQQEPGAWDHVVHPLGQSVFSVPQAGILHELAKNVFIASVNFDKPFAFSSSTWVIGDNCKKNVSKFVKLSSQSNAIAQSVSVSINNLADQPYKYLVKSANSPPSMRVLIPGNTSLLRWWFQGKPPFLIVGSSLQVSLSFNGSSMLINIQGFLTGCPGYLGITIEDLVTETEILKYDVLVSCPQQFGVVFTISNQDPSIDHTVDVLIDDAKHISQFILSYSPTLEQQTSKLAFTSDWKNAVFMTFGFVTLLFTAGFSLIFLSAVCWTCWKSLQLVCKRAFGKKFEMSTSKQNIQDPVPGGQDSWKLKVSRPLTFKSMNMHQRTLLVLYIVSKILTIIFCTFTVFFILLNAFVIQKTTDISRAVEKLQLKRSDKMSQYQHLLEKQIELDFAQQTDFLRQLYSEELNCFEIILTMTKLHLKNLTRAFNASSIMANKLKSQINLYREKTEAFTDGYRKKFGNEIRLRMSRYYTYLDLQVRNRWLTFPRRLFNLSLDVKVTGDLKVPSDERSAETVLNKTTFLFWDFVGVRDVIRSQSLPKSFWDKYFEMMSSCIDPKAMPTTTSRSSFCEENSTHPTIWHSSASHRISSSRFFATSWTMDQKTNRLPNVDIHSYSHHNDDGSSSLSAHQENSDSISLVEHLHIDVFRIVFFFIDIVLLFQRCTQLYLQTQSMFIGFKSRTALSPSQFWRLQLALELSGGFSSQSLRRQADSCRLDYLNPDKGASDGMVLLTEPTSGLHPYTIVTCNNAVSKTHDGNSASLHMGSTSLSTVDVDEIESSRGILFYFNLLLQSLLLQRLETAVLVVMLHFVLLSSINHILLSFVCCCPRMVLPYRDLVNNSALQSASGWQHLIKTAHWYKTHELSEFHTSLSSLLAFVKGQEESWRQYQHKACFLFPVGADKACSNANATESVLHEDIARLEYPCAYSLSYNRLNALPEFNISCAKNLSVLARSANDVITAFWQVLLACVLLVVLLHAVGTVILHFVKKSNIFPVRCVYETLSPPRIPISASATDNEKTEAVMGRRLEPPAVYRIMSSTTPETSPSSESNFAGLSRRSRVRFAPTIQISSADSSFGSIPTQMHLEVGYAESNV